MNTDPCTESSEVRSSCHREFQVTLLSETDLAQRLLAEFGFAVGRFKDRWPELKAHPARVIAGETRALAYAFLRGLSRRQMAAGLATSLAVVTSLPLLIVLLERRPENRVSKTEAEFDLVSVIHFPNSPIEKASDSGVGAGESGRVGFENGRGEGSRPEPARARGGGGGGKGSQLPASQGRPPIPSPIPAPIPTAALRQPQALPLAGIDLDPALWRKLDYAAYGDPRSKSVSLSSGPGNDGGVGTGTGPGIGEGDGPGFGPGRDGNMGGDGKDLGSKGEGGSRGNDPSGDDLDRVYKSPEVSTRPRVISKPEPQYTEQARRDGITGTVVLRVVFSGTGQVTNIHTVQKLPGGLTEKAIAAARQIRFVPATRNGQPVSMYMQLEYNFNLY